MVKVHVTGYFFGYTNLNGVKGLQDAMKKVEEKFRDRAVVY